MHHEHSRTRTQKLDVCDVRMVGLMTAASSTMKSRGAAARQSQGAALAESLL